MTREPPALQSDPLPRHVAVIMDGNGRWAKRRGQPRPMGHRAGVKAVRKTVRAAAKAGVEVLTLFAFSQENWKRPELEVKLLMQLFISTLAREVNALHKNGIRVRFIGEHGDFVPELRAEMRRAEKLTAANTGLTVVIAVGYGGQQDIVQAAQHLAAAGKPITAEALEARLSTHGLPLPDLLIRTGGERRISNFLLWQLAYAELYFCDTLWPEFDDAAFAAALHWYARRERRFGRVPEAA
ncbi:MAG TPA: polyprenyl diphosphate synthase [Solimonas sp.]|nr:polyprenyl diphosphate synthase [Solimonas sp.]